MGKIADVVAKMLAEGRRSADIVGAVMKLEGDTVPQALVRTRRAGIIEAFDDYFWPAYPHKTGKPDALKAFTRKWEAGASLGEILDGIDRYKASKPADRPWLNPATFLNQERWKDQPAAVGTPSASNMFNSLAERFDDADAQRERGNSPGIGAPRQLLSQR